ncbi:MULTISPECIES: hypothetical protein [Nostocales]|uniref:hypothetical protein n=1 Tax=Nostocales TaxID=1161 RepID=UPI0004984E54|nr:MULTISPECIES: hypothetical protein [Nostocales]
MKTVDGKHNPKVSGSNPLPATNLRNKPCNTQKLQGFVLCCRSEIHLVETDKRQRKPRSAKYHDGWELILQRLVIPFLCEDAPNLAHAGGLRSFSREFTRRVIKRSLIKNWYK